MKKIITLYFVLLLSAISLFAVDIPAETKLYLTPNANWKVDNARFAAYFFGNSVNAWESMTAVSGVTDLYEVTTPTGGPWTNVIFVRMNPANTTNDWTNKWNQTNDLVYDGTNNHYTVAEGAWDKGAGTWSIYTPISTNVSKVKLESIASVKNNLITASFEGRAAIKLFSVTGKLICNCTADKQFTYTASSGIYLLRINNETHKLIVL